MGISIPTNYNGQVKLPDGSTVKVRNGIAEFQGQKYYVEDDMVTDSEENVIGKIVNGDLVPGG